MKNNLVQPIRIGLMSGFIAIFLALIGMVETFDKRDVISEVISLGATVLLLTILSAAYLAARGQSKNGVRWMFTAGAVSGLVGGGALALFIFTTTLIDMRGVFINVKATLIKMLTLEQEVLALGLMYLIGVSTITGLVGTALYLTPSRVRQALLVAFLCVLALGVMQELLRVTFANVGFLADLIRSLYEKNGLSRVGAASIFIVTFTLTFAWSFIQSPVQARIAALSPRGQFLLKSTSFLLLFAALFFIPKALDNVYIGEVMSNVGLFILMGLGLNIVVGFAGLLDLGYVAFFAIGAYTVGVLTSPERGGTLNFWQALPIAISIAVLFGFILGIPVLKIRGDYLAIVTMGFGEIIRILVLSDFLRPWLGGAGGIVGIPKAEVLGFKFAGPIEIYYIILIGILIVVFLAIRLKDSRLGRAWMAVREDEDVAQAMGINLVWTKLIAFAIGASFAGISGAIFATKLSTIYPQSFKFDVSINVLALLILGGMGSIPGVIIGALMVVGLPELFREFDDFLFLVYGAALVVMMQLRPEGLWPETTRLRELHHEHAPAEPTTAD